MGFGGGAVHMLTLVWCIGKPGATDEPCCRQQVSAIDREKSSFGEANERNDVCWTLQQPSVNVCDPNGRLSQQAGGKGEKGEL